MRYAMIMAGGSGTRLWPMSRKARPKQLIPFLDGGTLLERSVRRIAPLIPIDRQFISTSEAFRSNILERIPAFRSDHILGEPVPRNTANAIAFVAAVLSRIDAQAVVVVLTADHLISPEVEFRAVVERGFQVVERDPGRLATFSIEPTFPATQYGYVQRLEPIESIEGAFVVERFVEKPKTEAKAQYLIDTGRCAWNSGMFVFSASGYLRAYQTFMPENHVRVQRIQRAWESASQNDVLREEYPNLTAQSVDYAIMEPASVDERFEVCTVLMDVDWLDVGSWPSFAKTLVSMDEHHNRASGRLIPFESRGITAVTEDPTHTIATIGCEGLIIVQTKDATLICRARDAEKVKTLAEEVIPPELR